MIVVRAVAGLLCSMALAGFSRAADLAPDFSGRWSRTTFGLDQPEKGPGPVRNLTRRPDGTADPRMIVGDIHNPILKPAAIDVLERNAAISRQGRDYPGPSNSCWPMAAPYIFRVLDIQILQEKDRVTILYMQDHQIRRIRLDQSHPEHVTPSWYGDSVGHFEGDTLVVDTVGVKNGPYPMVDMLGTPHSEALHVVERYRLIDAEAAKRAQERSEDEFGHPTTAPVWIDPDYKGKGLQIAFTVEDETFFTMPWSGSVTYRRGTDYWDENVCAENTREYYSGTTTHVPEAKMPEF